MTRYAILSSLWTLAGVFALVTVIVALAPGQSEPAPAPAYATAAAATLDVLEDVVVVDGDTVKADIYLGRGVLLRRQRVRLEGFDAWESNRIRFRDKTTADELRKGKLATEALAKLIRESEIQLLSDGGRGPHGRPVGRLRLIQRDGSVVNVEQTMIAEGHDRRLDRLGHER